MKHHILKPKKEVRQTQFKLDLIKLLVVVAVIIIAFALLYKPVTGLINEDNRYWLKAQVSELGFIAHIAYILIVAVLVVLSFIPASSSITLIGGFAFGPVLGILYTTLGIMLGSTVAFYIGRRFGRPLLEDLVDPELLESFDEKSESKGLITLLLIFLIPFTPDNATCLVAGATKMRIRSMVMVAAIGRFPGTVVTTLIGSGFGSSFNAATIITITVFSLIIGLAYAHRAKIERHLKL